MNCTAPEVLFSERFQKLYELLGIFSYMYVGGDYKGIDRESFIKETRTVFEDAGSLLDFLVIHNLISDNSDILHLNRELFFSMSMWDLLVMAEPWIAGNGHPAEEYREINRMVRSEKLSLSYCP